VTNPMAVAVTG